MLELETESSWLLVWINLSLVLALLALINCKNHNRKYSSLSFCELHLSSLQLCTELFTVIWMIAGVKYDILRESRLVFALYTYWFGVIIWTLVHLYTSYIRKSKYHQEAFSAYRDDGIMFSAIYFCLFLIMVK